MPTPERRLNPKITNPKTETNRGGNKPRGLGEPGVPKKPEIKVLPPIADTEVLGPFDTSAKNPTIEEERDSFFKPEEIDATLNIVKEVEDKTGTEFSRLPQVPKQVPKNK